MKIDPVSLRLFLAVPELGTITAAAEREHIAASAVSKRISDLGRRCAHSCSSAATRASCPPRRALPCRTCPEASSMISRTSPR
ncbi:helix-turn-helix domain-containing protein [Cupriavidus oxalaticus]|uniref:helix-turn-helix domain-containing protein n=1 Tax=Cupriavidus oxalaticus TaxID=96344 RepID=UPI003D65647E